MTVRVQSSKGSSIFSKFIFQNNVFESGERYICEQSCLSWYNYFSCNLEFPSHSTVAFQHSVNVQDSFRLWKSNWRAKPGEGTFGENATI